MGLLAAETPEPAARLSRRAGSGVLPDQSWLDGPRTSAEGHYSVTKHIKIVMGDAALGAARDIFLSGMTTGARSAFLTIMCGMHDDDEESPELAETAESFALGMVRSMLSDHDAVHAMLSVLEDIIESAQGVDQAMN